MDRIIITKPMHGICMMQVCAIKNIKDKELLDYVNIHNPSGTKNGWTKVIRDDKEHPDCNPIKCADHPNKRVHFLIAC